MKLVVTINSREAIPVRALPWATRWYFGAAEVAEVLAGDLQADGFPAVAAYWWEAGEVRAIEPSYWANVVVGNVESAVQEIADRQQRQIEATKRIPAEAFVWRDEWEAAYTNAPDGPGALEKLVEDDPSLAANVAERRLDLDALLSPQVRAIVMESSESPVEGAVAETDVGNSAVARASGAAMHVAPTAENESRLYRTSARRNVLSPVVERVIQMVSDRTDTVALWSAALDLASASAPMNPLVGVVDGEIKYRSADDIRFIARKDFLARCARRLDKSR
jgi:hypothetical protein